MKNQETMQKPAQLFDLPVGEHQAAGRLPVAGYQRADKLPGAGRQTGSSPIGAQAKFA
jgi:hypothetical protein